jgi:hypothetical protein
MLRMQSAPRPKACRLAYCFFRFYCWPPEMSAKRGFRLYIPVSCVPLSSSSSSSSLLLLKFSFGFTSGSRYLPICRASSCSSLAGGCSLFKVSLISHSFSRPHLSPPQICLSAVSSQNGDRRCLIQNKARIHTQTHRHTHTRPVPQPDVTPHPFVSPDTRLAEPHHQSTTQPLSL